jgi:ribonucleoside-diphosphate reductase alpha chain/ribonucleoside-triphosphate reductase
MDALDAMGEEFDSPKSLEIFQALRKAANDESDTYSYEMRIPRPLLVTILKPEGSLSQLPTVSSGLHRAYAPYFIRRIRVSSIDPTCRALQALGVPNEPDQGKAERIVFSFPIKTEARISASDEPAKRQFERYLTLMDNYVDHNASCTLTIGDGEWEEMEELVYNNIDRMVACAFLPKDCTAYPQMPYEAISEERYNEMAKSFPNLSSLGDLINKFENEEYEGELIEDACSSGSHCPVR